MFLSMGLDGRFKLSLSARRAWIEIVAWLDYSEELLVALRKESVDRNIAGLSIKEAKPVALRKESVDRNIDNWTWAAGMWCRSPQGERG